MSDEITIEVNGVELKARKGQMLIEITDEAGIYIPRFCYHEKLSIAANCRMCLVQMEGGRKPMPACATPVMDGNKFQTRSAEAIAAQRATMEFLLINHPLDCPICDQGGECELQDLAMGFGRDISQYVEQKRVVKDKNLGPLVSTDMTRCIHCTRCVRFGEEIAGIQELGTFGRGEDMEIGTFIERSVDHELSGNIIDLCPVGALNSKPARYTGRSWEMAQIETVAPHDCVGSNLYAHVKDGKVLRVVPRPTEEINETWISDRDRFSYEGIYSEDRLTTPMVKDENGWRETDWPTALDAAASRLAAIADKSRLGTLISPNATLEEQYLCARIARRLGSYNVDHRLRTTDFSHQEADPVYPWLGCSIADIEQQGALLVIGSNIRREAPIIAHRLRKASLVGAKVMFVNRPGLEYFFPVHEYIGASASDLVAELAALAQACGGRSQVGLNGGGAEIRDAHREMATALRDSDKALVMLGHLSQRHPRFTLIRALAADIARASGSKLGYLPEAANSVGAWLTGAVPHRLVGGVESPQVGRNAGEMLAGDIDAFLMLGLEPELDSCDGEAAVKALKSAQSVISLTSFASPAALEYADVMLPVGTFAETAGTFVNLEGRWQSFTGVCTPVGMSRPAWKVLRVLAEQLDLDGFGFNQLDEITTALHERLDRVSPDNTLKDGLDYAVSHDNGVTVVDVPMYQVDPLVRRSQPLQQTAEATTKADVF